MMTGESDNGSDPVDPYVEKVEAAAERFSPVANTLAGDLRDFVLDLVRMLPKTWAQMSENEQTSRGHTIADACRKVVREAVGLLETDQRTTIEVELEEIGFKPKGIVAKIAVHAIEPSMRHALVDACGKEILIVVADGAQYMGERAPVRIDKQQPDLPLGPTGEAERKIDADIASLIECPDGSKKPAAFVSDLSIEREQAERDPRAAGKAAAARGFNETRNPLTPGSDQSQQWLAGHAEGMNEKLASAAAGISGRRSRRRANGPVDDPG